MRYEVYKSFFHSYRKLYQTGGKYQKAAETALKIKGKFDLDDDPFHGIPMTNHGEKRIKHCVKYDLTGFCRLITVQNNGVCLFCFVGNHDDCEKWLECNKGLTLIKNENSQLTDLRESTDLNEEEKRISGGSDFSTGKLSAKLPARYFDRVAKGVPWSLLREFEKLESIDDEEVILELACKIQDPQQAEVFYDVFVLLRDGNVDEAKSRIDLYLNESTRIEQLSPQEIDELVQGDNFIDFEQFEAEIIDHYMKTASFQDWMLFMHPEQRKIVDQDFKGPARLSGVSGSGKTCVVIKRAIRLAQQYSDEKILVLTLNRSLARLIDDLVNHACPPTCRKNIVVRSFWELCREQLRSFNIADFSKKYQDVTWRMGEHISEIWHEFYHCEKNNEDARVLLPIHQSLLNRGISPMDYLYQEFDYIRSAFPLHERQQYLTMERQGRCIPFEEHFREIIMQALSHWEEKMEFVGITDYLGLASALHKYFDRLEPKYRCVLVDEAQDFGSIELKIIRRLVTHGENDIFLSGDSAQQVHTKYQNFKDTGINIPGGRSSFIKKNYRNSREILSAAFDVLKANMPEGVVRLANVEILDPEFANFSTPKPHILRAKNLDEEFAYCFHFLKNTLDDNEKACIALCGYTLKEVKNIGTKLKLPILDGTTEIDQGQIFLSDLEQTKGFEFDKMVIVNCNQHVLPNPNLPNEEWYRELFKLYVSMTRAKRSLIISYSQMLSEFFLKSKDFFLIQDWKLQEENNTIEGFQISSSSESRQVDKAPLDCTGLEFLYKKEAIGLPKEVGDKLLEVVRGMSVAENGKQKEWKTIGELLLVRDVPTKANLFGHQTYDRFEEFFQKYKS